MTDPLHKRHAGLIADEVAAVLPEVVHTEESADGSGSGMQSIAYGNFVSLLLQGMRELIDEVDALKAVRST